MVIKIHPGDNIIGLRLLGLFLQGQHVPVPVKLHHAEGPGVRHIIAEHRRPPVVPGGGVHGLGKIRGVKQVIPQDEAHAVLPHKILPDEQRVRNAPGPGLHGKGDLHTDLAAVSQQALKGRRLSRGHDDEHLADPRLDEHGQGIIDQRLIIDRKQRLADRLRHGIKSGPAPGSQNNTFHGNDLL